MTLPKFTGWLAVGALAVATTVSTGCATKSYVRNQVAPIDQRVNQVGQETNQNKDAIAKLGDKEETDTSRVSEQAMGAENAAKDAANAAQQADQKAGQAQTMASNTDQHVNQLNQTWQSEFENRDNYQLVSTEKVLFKFNSAMLTKEAKGDLDSAVQSMTNAQHYVIEIQGFTDTTGTKAYNIALSQRRADAVVRYLMVEHQVPLHRIHVIGLGDQEPSASNHTRAGRQENRRVEVKLFAANATPAASPTAQGTMPGANEESQPEPEPTE
jgi:outer membrane protein OmpA-like peptidoglycan-associated protein